MHARLTVVAGTALPESCDLTPPQTVTLGRNRHSSIVLRDEHASRSHAEIIFKAGRWYLRDCGTTNGTRRNGTRLLEPVALEHDDQISIGDIRICFQLEQEVGVAPAAAPVVSAEEPHLVETEPAEESSTTLHADELSVLVRFMNESLRETTPNALLSLALAVVRRQTRADLCGFLNLDPDHPLPRIVLPDEAEVNSHLSRQLTQGVLQSGRPIWLAKQAGRPESDSLASLADAVCIPLRCSLGLAPPSARPETPLGALHVYQKNRLFNEREVGFCEALAGCLANSLRVLRSHRALAADYSRVRQHDPNQDDQLIGPSAALHAVKQQIERLADSPSTVLIIGESGVGKELVATALHRLSPRRSGPLVPVNCAAIVASMPEAALFGHKAGSFTGATCNRSGFFQQADDGTLFLDEIGELSLDCQAMLLRVLESRSFHPVGATQPITVDVRIIAATNRDLEKEVSAGRFRQDLFYRFGMSIRVPPLRSHAEDIPELAEHFMRMFRAQARRHVELSDPALARLQAFSWPGNVRQLRSVLEHAVVMNKTGVILPDDLHLVSVAPNEDHPGSLNLEEVEAWTIRRALLETAGNITQAAKLLGIHRETLNIKMKKYAIERPG
jgi:two-component system, NtrC family, response regulator HydG